MTQNAAASVGAPSPSTHARAPSSAVNPQYASAASIPSSHRNRTVSTIPRRLLITRPLALSPLNILTENDAKACEAGYTSRP